jgi:hypothetical protein
LTTSLPPAPFVAPPAIIRSAGEECANILDLIGSTREASATEFITLPDGSKFAFRCVRNAKGELTITIKRAKVRTPKAEAAR